jgi:phage baseplate assembly protein W
MNLDYPFHFDGRARTAAADDAGHIRDMIEQVLFTQPGERVNRPDFGSGILQLLFSPASPEVAATTEFMVKGALQQWLGDVIVVERVFTEAEESTLRVSIDYVVSRTGEQTSANFTRTGGGT